MIALDANYKIVDLLRPTNLQWNRKYHEPEIGRVVQTNFLSQQGYQYIQLSGYFEENELNRHIVYQKGTSNIINSPTWAESSGAAETVAYAFFNGFNDCCLFNLPILPNP